MASKPNIGYLWNIITYFTWFQSSFQLSNTHSKKVAGWYSCSGPIYAGMLTGFRSSSFLTYSCVRQWVLWWSLDISWLLPGWTPVSSMRFLIIKCLRPILPPMGGEWVIHVQTQQNSERFFLSIQTRRADRINIHTVHLAHFSLSSNFGTLLKHVANKG